MFIQQKTFFKVRKVNECLQGIYASKINSQKIFLKYCFKNFLNVLTQSR